VAKGGGNWVAAREGIMGRSHLGAQPLINGVVPRHQRMPDGGNAVTQCLLSVDGTEVAARARAVTAASSGPGVAVAAVQSTPRNAASPFTVCVRPCLSRTSR
jgi:hypothetical protein